MENKLNPLEDKIRLATRILNGQIILPNSVGFLNAYSRNQVRKTLKEIIQDHNDCSSQDKQIDMPKKWPYNLYQTISNWDWELQLEFLSEDWSEEERNERMHEAQAELLVKLGFLNSTDEFNKY